MKRKGEEKGRRKIYFLPGQEKTLSKHSDGEKGRARQRQKIPLTGKRGKTKKGQAKENEFLSPNMTAR